MSSGRNYTLKDLQADIPKRIGRSRKALVLGLTAAAKQAQRAIQWSIAGGGYEGGEPSAPVAPKPPKTRPKKAKARTAKPTKAKASKGGKMRKAKDATRARRPKTTKGRSATRAPKSAKAKRVRRPDPCTRRPPPAYRTPVDTGNYKGSFKTLLELDRANPRITIRSEASPAVKTGVIELGRRPAPIPIEPLTQWVKRKLGCTDPMKARSIAFAISKAASKKRRKGLRVIQRARGRIQDVAHKAIRDYYEGRER